MFCSRHFAETLRVVDAFPADGAGVGGSQVDSEQGRAQKAEEPDAGHGELASEKP